MSVRFLWAADAIPGMELCDRPVHKIEILGNDVTRPPVILRELAFQPGDTCNLDRVIDGIQSIQDLGLFTQVYAEMRLVEDQLHLVYVVREKFYFLAIPRFSRTSDGELRAGLQLRWDNFLGRLHELRLTSEKRQEDDGQGRTGFVHSVDYRVPRFFASDFGLSLAVSAERKQVSLAQNRATFGEALRESDALSFTVSRWLGQSRGINGWRVFAGLGVQHRDYELRDGELGPFRSGQEVSAVMGAEQRRLGIGYYRRRGAVIGGQVQIASEALGSDFVYHRLSLYGRWYRPLATGTRNLNVHARLGISDGAAFGEHSFAIGGGESLRGLDPSARSGDVLTLVNIEYLSAFYAYPAWRWVLFSDLGNVYRRDRIRLLNQRVRVGVGLRWKIEKLTNTDLRVDVAWDPDKRQTQFYLATRLTF